MAYSDLLAAMEARDGAFHVTPGDEWRQGQTLYGGLSAALAVEAGTRAFPDLPPLRSAQIAFVGPSTGPLTITPGLLRRGKSSAFVSVATIGESGAATQATLCHGAARDSAHIFTRLPMPDVPGPEGLPDFFAGGRGPTFSRQFDARLAGGGWPTSGSARPECLVWLRLRDAAPPSGPATLVALGDALPPAVMTQFTAFAPISSMTWSVEFLSSATPPGGDWYLMHSIAETAGEGYSAQTMTLWHESAAPVLISRQTVAIYA
ncbi:thioesterase family protein [Sphingomonas sp. SCN 67-18]|uniref:acyl-CoA thioesterase n=1 Tax=uncultured Sphingomonas sp. TaxID=158754 RepID=UPI000AA479C5|nr:thioesterase family protein [Sphingomonas sp. SCN 67-18]